MPIAEGKKAPDFTLENAEGTKEACGFRDRWKDLRRAGVVVLGISGDAPATHAKFATKYKLPFSLLSDPARKVMQAWGAYGEKMMYGKKTQGVIRSTVWIGRDGVVKKHWARVSNAAAHPEKVFETVHMGGSSAPQAPRASGRT